LHEIISFLPLLRIAYRMFITQLRRREYRVVGQNENFDIK
jgi:hypothetical protein